jgi:hypothetical protein
MRHKISRGEWFGNTRFGHRVSPDGRRVEPDAAEQKTLAKVRDLAAERQTRYLGYDLT